MHEIKFDFNNMFSHNVGKKHGVQPGDLKRLEKLIKKAHEHLKGVIENPISRINLGLEWTRLPYQDKKCINAIQETGKKIAQKFENVIFLGIGGSYLGLKAAQDALCPPYYNEFSSLRNARPKIYFDGNNLDPENLTALLKNLDPLRTCVIIISKSGETIETRAAFEVVEAWLKNYAGANYGRQIFAITDPESGSLRQRADEEQKRDKESFSNFPLLKGIGGRYSEFNIGLLHLAIIGVDIESALTGARDMYERCRRPSVFENPAYMYAVLHYILYKKKGKDIAVFMPFSENLKSTADWYAQLLAESLGKKYSRKIKKLPHGVEEWSMDLKHIVNTGRTPVVCRGTTDLHSIQQNNVEGKNNKAITFIRIENFPQDLEIPQSESYIGGKSFSKILNLAQEATQWSLTLAQRPNCKISLPEVSPYTWAGLLFFLQMATAFEGELININAFDQPGVEGYKKYLYFKLGKPGISDKTKNEINKKHLVKKAKFII